MVWVRQRVLIYLGASAILSVLAAPLLLSLGLLAPPAAAHLVFVVGVLPLIFGAIGHFVPVLTRSGGAHGAVRRAPLALQGFGLLLILDFSGWINGMRDAIAIGMLATVGGFAGWMIRRAQRTLGKPHPGWRWYLTSVAMLATALCLIPAMRWWPEWHTAWRLLHLHLNTLGFIGLTALGTLQVLLPTALNVPDPGASLRLWHDLPMAAAATLAVAIGAAFWVPLALAGAAAWVLLVLRVAAAWQSRYGRAAIAAPAVALTGALAGFLLLLAAGVAHAFAVLDGRDAIKAFVVAFLLPLLTGALTQLLPVWRYPDKRRAVRDQMHARLRAAGAARVLLFLGGGGLLLVGESVGLWLAAAGAMSFVLAVLQSLTKSRAEGGE